MDRYQFTDMLSLRRCLYQNFDGKEVSNSDYMCQNLIIVMGSGECDDSCWNC